MSLMSKREHLKSKRKKNENWCGFLLLKLFYIAILHIPTYIFCSLILGGVTAKKKNISCVRISFLEKKIFKMNEKLINMHL